MTKSIRFGIARGLTGLIATILLATAASAQQAFTTRTAHVRAGPDRGYPLVATLPPGVSVYVNGCLGNYSWCDVSAGPNRGWVYARQLQYTYQGRPLTIYGNGALLALPIVVFGLGSYWHSYYRDRPWYRQQNRWNDWRPGAPRSPGFRPSAPRDPVIRPLPRPPGPRFVAPPHPSHAPHPRAQPMPKPHGQPIPHPRGQERGMGPAPVRQ